MANQYGFTDEYVADYFVRHPEKDYVTLNELREDANSLFEELFEEIGLKPLEVSYYGSVLGYENHNKHVRIIF